MFDVATQAACVFVLAGRRSRRSAASGVTAFDGEPTRVECARAQGIISFTRQNKLIALAEQRFGGGAAAVSRAAANKNHAKSTGIANHQLQNLGYRINDVVTSLGSGTPAMQVLAQQGGQIVQILGETGVSGALRGIGGAVLGFLTPARVGLGALAAVVVSAYSS